MELKSFKELADIYLNRDKEDEFDALISAVFRDYPFINTICAAGYTPGFNDGDPCYHSDEISVDDFNYANVYEYDDDWFYEEAGARPKASVIQKEEEEIRDCVCGALSASGLFEYMFETNFKVVIRRQEHNGYEIVEEEYYCGW